MESSVVSLPSVLLLHLQLDLVVDRVRPVLLVLSRRRLPSHHLHLHGPRQKQLLLLLLVLERVHPLRLASNDVVLQGVPVWVVHTNPCGWNRRPFRLLVVVLVQLVDVQAAPALVHVHVSSHGTLDLDRLRAVTLLRVQLAAVNGLDLHHVALWVHSRRVVRRGNDGAAGRVEPEVSLVHQLLVEARVHGSVVVLNRCVVVVPTRRVDLGSILK